MNATITNKQYDSRELNDSELDDVSGGVLGLLIGIAIGAGTTMVITDVLTPRKELKAISRPKTS